MLFLLHLGHTREQEVTVMRSHQSSINSTWSDLQENMVDAQQVNIKVALQYCNVWQLSALDTHV